MVYSRLNKNLKLDQEHYAITLLCTKGSCVNQHTEIAIEGINKNNRYFMTIAHLVGTSINFNNNVICGFLGSAGKVKLTPMKNPDRLKYYSKTETWLRPKYAVLDMVEQIQLEKNNPQLTPRFHILGRHSIFANLNFKHIDYLAKLWLNIVSFSALCPIFYIAYKLVRSFCIMLQPQLLEQRRITDNCFTWAREKIKHAGVFLPEKQSEALFVSIHQYTNAHTLIAMVP